VKIPSLFTIEKSCDMNLTIWCSALLGPPARATLTASVADHRLVFAKPMPAHTFVASAPDPQLSAADIAFGQPDPAQCLDCGKLRWLEVPSAGYARYDSPGLRNSFQQRSAKLSNASRVFSGPCAEHVLAMMLSVNRGLPWSRTDQDDREWRKDERRRKAKLLVGQTVVIVGFGSIGQRLAELLAPFQVRLLAVRRQPVCVRGVISVPEDGVARALAAADHVVDLLPENPSTQNYFNAARFGICRPGANFYNIGRGNTVDQDALLAALASGRIGAAYLDVFREEPLPIDNPLWQAPNCFITPHIAGGRADQDDAVVQHFLGNLERFAHGRELEDRIF
jgi:phosphoglycerate dehydrogenase-like enzyme